MIICQINRKHLAFKFNKQLHVGKYVFMPSGIINDLVYELHRIVKINKQNNEIHCYNLLDDSIRIHTYDMILRYNPYLK